MVEVFLSTVQNYSRIDSLALLLIAVVLNSMMIDVVSMLTNNNSYLSRILHCNRSKFSDRIARHHYLEIELMMLHLLDEDR